MSFETLKTEPDEVLDALYDFHQMCIDLHTKTRNEIQTIRINRVCLNPLEKLQRIRERNK